LLVFFSAQFAKGLNRQRLKTAKRNRFVAVVALIDPIGEYFFDFLCNDTDLLTAKLVDGVGILVFKRHAAKFH